MRDDDRPLLLPSHEALSRLARERPEAFEALRLELINSLLENAPERVKRRLLGLQFRIDGIRRLSHSPLGATVKIHTLMWASFLQMNDALQKLAELTQEPTAAREIAGEASHASEHTANVIQFPPRISQVPCSEYL